MTRDAVHSNDTQNYSPPSSALRELVEAFERAWRSGERPQIDEFLTSSFGVDRQALLLELTHVDLELRLAGGEPARIEEYLSRFPDLSSDPQKIVGLIRTEYEMRRRREPSLSVDEYVERFPACRDLLAAQVSGESFFERQQADAAAGGPAPKATRMFKAGSPTSAPRQGFSDGNLLFGMLALQNGFVSGKDLLAAMNAWLLEKQTPLGQLLVRQQAIKSEDLGSIEAAVSRHLRTHDDVAAPAEESASTMDSLKDQAASVAADDDEPGNLGDVAKETDPEATIVQAVGKRHATGARFRILEPHRKGGLGEVFKAYDCEVPREVALKQIQEPYADHPESRSRFVFEAKTTGRLQHPGIVPVYSLGAYPDGRPYYAMRFISGDSLNDVLKIKPDKNGRRVRNSGEKKVWLLRELLGNMIAVCNAIEYAHARRVLHRDLKPANIMLGKYGETLVVDWGLAKAIGEQETPGKSDTLVSEVSLRAFSENDSEPTRQGRTLGTPQFMSPEQAAGRHDELGPKSDVYSLGATLYHVLAGEAPLAECSKDTEEVLGRVRRGDIAPVRQINPHVPKALDAICRKAMALSPGARYSSARELAGDLEHWLADEPISAQPDSLSDRLFRLARRHRAAAISASAAAILIAILATVAAGIFNKERRFSADLAHKNAELATSEQRARKEAETKALEAKQSAEKAEDESQKAKASEARETVARERADVAAQKAEDEAKNAKESEAMEKVAREKAEKLADFLIGAIQPEDPTRFTGATFYAPKADAKDFKVVDMLNVELDRATKELKGEPLTQAAVFDSIGNVCRQLAMFKEAEKLLTEALRIRSNNQNTDPSELATSYFHLAWYFQERGELSKAKELYAKTLGIREEQKDRTGEAETHQNLGWLYFYEDDANAADKHFGKALRIRQELLNAAAPERRETLLRDVVFTKLGMAGAYAGLNMVLRAKKIADDKELRNQLIELGHQELSDALLHFVNAGNSLVERESAGAIHELEQCLALIQAADRAETALAVHVHLELAHALNKASRAADAEKHFRRAFEIARDQNMLQIPHQERKIEEFADLLRRKHKHDEAEAVWQHYLKQQKFRFTKSHPYYQKAESAYQLFWRNRSRNRALSSVEPGRRTVLGNAR